MRELFTAAIALHCIQERDQNVFVVVILQNSWWFWWNLVHCFV